MFINIPSGVFTLQINDALCVTIERKQYKFPKSRKKRIRKKWRKNLNNYRTKEVHKAIRINETTILVSTKIFDELKKTIKPLSLHETTYGS